uniref:Uncharacterized protein n=1 Tax=Octopus bimaculoides TaxID=37653 RepID=A0A0L8I6Z5_OCTBM
MLSMYCYFTKMKCRHRKQSLVHHCYYVCHNGTRIYIIACFHKDKMSNLLTITTCFHNVIEHSSMYFQYV